MRIIGKNFYSKLNFSSEGLLFLNCSPADFKEVKHFMNMVAVRKHYYENEYLLSGKAVGIDHFRLFTPYGNQMHLN